MKKIIAFILTLQTIFVFNVFGESISVAVVVPKQNVTLDQNTFSILKSKIENAMLQEGITTATYSGIVVYPVLNINNQQMIEGGMRNITTIDVEVNLYVKQIVTETSFNSFVKNYKGDGYSVDEAKKNAIAKINSSDSELLAFIAEAKTRIIKYFQSNTTTIIKKAKTLAATQQYSEALALLASYPESLSGYPQVADAAAVIYKQYLNKNCSQLLQQARGEYALGNYEEAISILSDIDMESPCSANAKSLSASIKKTIETKKAQEIALNEKHRQQAIALDEKHRQQAYALKKQTVSAIRDVATAFFSSNPRYNYRY